MSDFTYSAELQFQTDAPQKLDSSTSAAVRLRQELEKIQALTGGGGSSNAGGGLGATASAAQQAAAALNGAGAAAANAGGTFGGLGGAVQGLVGGLGAAGGSTIALGLALGGGLAMVGLVAVGLKDYAGALRDIYEEGLRYNAQLEIERVGIAASTLTFRQYKDVTGEVLDQQDSMNLAMIQAAQSQEKLKASVFGTASTLVELSHGFMQLKGASAGQIATDEDVVRLTRITANLAALRGLDPATMFRQMTLAVEGFSRANSQLGLILRSEGVDAATLRNWAEQGVAVQKLTELLAQYDKAAGEVRNTMTGVASDIRDAWQQIEMAAAKPLFEPVKAAMKGLRDDLVSVNSSGVELNSSLVAPLASIGRSLGTIINTLGRPMLDVAEVSIEALLRLTQGVAVVVAKLIEYNQLLGSIRQVGGFIRDLFPGEPNLPVQAPAASASPGFGAASANALSAGLFGQGFDADATETNRKLTETDKTIRELTASTEKLRLETQALQEGAFAAARTEAIAKQGAALAALSEKYPGLVQGSALYNAVEAQRAAIEEKTAASIQKTNEASREAASAFGDSATVLEDRIAKVSQGLDKLAGSAEDIQKTQAASQQIDELTRSYDSLGKVLEKQFKDDPAYARLAADLDAARQRLDALIGKWNELQSRDPIGGSLGVQADAQVQAFAKIQAAAQSLYDGIRAAETKGTTDYAADLANRHALTLDGFQKRLDALRKELGDEGALYLRDLAAFKELQQKYAEEEKHARSAVASLQAGDIAGMADALKQYADALGVTTSQAAADLVQKLGPTVTTFQQGVVLGFLEIQANVKTTGQVIAEMGKQLHDTFEKGLGDLLYGATQGLDGIKNALKSWADEILKTYTQTFAKLLSNWRDTQQQMSYENAPGFVGPPSQGARGGSSQTIDLAAAGITFSANALSNSGLGHGTFDYAGILASLGSLIGGGWIGALVGAVVGVVAGALKASQGEIEANISQLDPRTRGTNQDWLAQYQTSINTVSAGLVDALRTGGGNQAASLVAQMNAAMEAYIHSFVFLVHAGSSSDFSADVRELLTHKIPLDIIHTMFGSQAFQATGSDTYGNQVGTGGMAGVQGGVVFDASTFDPNAPIPRMLAGLGFTANKIREISEQVDPLGPEKFLAYLNSLVSIVTSFRDISATLSQDASQRMAGFVASDNANPADYFTTAAANLAELGRELSMYTGDEQITRAQDLIQLYQQYEQQQEQALRKLYDLANQISSSIEKQRDAIHQFLETPSEAHLRESNVVSMAAYRIGQATTPEQVQAIATDAEQAISALFADIQRQVGAIRQLQADLGSLADQFHELGRGGRVAANGIDDFFHAKVNIDQQLAASALLHGDERIAADQRVHDSAMQLYQDMLSFIDRAHQAAQQVADDVSRVTQGWRDALLSPDQLAENARATIAATPGLIAGATTPEQVTAAIQGALTAGQLLFDQMKTSLDAARATLQAIAQDVISLHQSVAQQRESMATALMNPAQQDAYYKQQIALLMSQLEGASSEQQIRDLTQRIQQHVSADFSLYGPNDPQRGAAQHGLDQVLAAMEAAATAAYQRVSQATQDTVTTLETAMSALATQMDALGSQGVQRLNDLGAAAEALAGQIGSDLAAGVFRLNDEMTTLWEQATTLDVALYNLELEVRNRLTGPNGIAQQIIDANAPLVGPNGALAQASALFTGMNSSMSTFAASMADPTTGATAAVDRFQAALNRVSALMEAMATGNYTPTSSRNTDTTGFSRLAARYPRVLQTVTGQ